jgi:hypothetical protein
MQYHYIDGGWYDDPDSDAPDIRWPPNRPLPHGFSPYVISEGRLNSGDEPVVAARYSAYRKLGDLIMRSYDTILTPEWFESRIYENKDEASSYRGYLHAFTEHFWKADSGYHAELSEQDPIVRDNWFNLPVIAQALEMQLSAYVPGWKYKARRAAEQATQTALLNETQAFMQAMRAPHTPSTRFHP